MPRAIALRVMRRASSRVTDHALAELGDLWAFVATRLGVEVARTR